MTKMKISPKECKICGWLKAFWTISLSHNLFWILSMEVVVYTGLLSSAVTSCSI